MGFGNLTNCCCFHLIGECLDVSPLNQNPRCITYKLTISGIASNSACDNCEEVNVTELILNYVGGFGYSGTKTVGIYTITYTLAVVTGCDSNTCCSGCCFNLTIRPGIPSIITGDTCGGGNVDYCMSFSDNIGHLYTNDCSASPSDDCDISGATVTLLRSCNLGTTPVDCTSSSSSSASSSSSSTYPCWPDTCTYEWTYMGGQGHWELINNDCGNSDPNCSCPQHTGGGTFEGQLQIKECVK